MALCHLTLVTKHEEGCVLSDDTIKVEYGIYHADGPNMYMYIYIYIY